MLHCPSSSFVYTYIHMHHIVCFAAFSLPRLPTRGLSVEVWEQGSCKCCDSCCFAWTQPPWIDGRLVNFLYSAHVNFWQFFPVALSVLCRSFQKSSQLCHSHLLLVYKHWNCKIWMLRRSHGNSLVFFYCIMSAINVNWVIEKKMFF